MPKRSPIYAWAFAVVAALSVFLSGCRTIMVDKDCYCGPIPNKEKLAALKVMGVKTIVLCRINPMPGKAEEIRQAGLNYVHIPTGLFIPPGEPEISKFLSVIRDPQMRPVYICDQVARDRANFYSQVTAMVVDGISADKASWQMYRNGLRHWWPWFYKYKTVVRDHEKEIHGEAAYTPNGSL